MSSNQNIIMALLAMLSQHMVSKRTQASFGSVSVDRIANLAAGRYAKTRRRIITTV
jgi:hypothetical protein